MSFFFQAEDGIRDLTVTGVQTCALPISNCAHNVSIIPSDGFLPATVPAQFAAWCTALLHFGTASLAETLGPAVEMAESGFPMYTALRNGIAKVAERYRAEWPTSAALYLGDGQLPEDGQLHK